LRCLRLGARLRSCLCKARTGFGLGLACSKTHATGQLFKEALAAAAAAAVAAAPTQHCCVAPGWLAGCVLLAFLGGQVRVGQVGAH